MVASLMTTTVGQRRRLFIRCTWHCVCRRLHRGADGGRQRNGDPRVSFRTQPQRRGAGSPAPPTGSDADLEARGHVTPEPLFGASTPLARPDETTTTTTRPTTIVGRRFFLTMACRHRNAPTVGARENRRVADVSPTSDASGHVLAPLWHGVGLATSRNSPLRRRRRLPTDADGHHPTEPPADADTSV